MQADLKTFHQFGVYGTAVPAVLTVQNTIGVESSTSLEPALVRSQLECLQRDIPPAAAKTGALGNARIVREVAAWAAASCTPLVVDPVIASTSGRPLASEGALDAILRDLLPRCTIVTPNLAEASRLSGIEVTSVETMASAARRIADLGPPWVLVKGGHLAGDATDLLWSDGRSTLFRERRIAGGGRHGTGCAYSAAVAASLAWGRSPEDAVASAKQFVTAAIRDAQALGEGCWPVNHHAPARLPDSSRPDSSR